MLDLRDAIRSLARTPGLAATAVLSLAVGIAANTAVFTVVNAMLFKPLPVERPEELVAIYTLNAGSAFPDAFSYPDYLDYTAQTQVLRELVGHYGTALSMAGSGDRAELVWGELVTGNYFEGLGVRPALGRLFTRDDDRRPGGHPVAVLSDGFWARRFARDPRVLGRALRLNGHDYTVIGVAGFGFSGTRFLGFIPDVWVPLAMRAQVLHEQGDEWHRERGWRWLNVNGRLASGTTIEQARAGLNATARQLAQSYPDTNRGVTVKIVPASTKTQPLPGGDRILTVISTALMGTVGLGLLVACANVANLLMARASARRREIAIRLALGASRWRLIRMLLVESFALAVPSGALGLLFGSWLIDALATTGPPLDFATVNPAYDLAMDYRVFLFTLAISAASSLVFGLLPAFHGSRTDVLPAIKGDGTTAGGQLTRFSARNFLVVAQIALSLILLISTGLFVRSAHQARRLDPGFETRQVLIASVNPGVHGYSEARGLDLYRRIIERTATMPAVQSVSLASLLPLDDSTGGARVLVEGYVLRSPSEATEALYTIVGPRYFTTMGTRIVRGREFDDRDSPGALRTAIVNEAMAERYWPGRDPIGRRFRLDGEAGPAVTVVGVAKTGKYITLAEDPVPYFFLPLWQNYASRVRILLRTRSDPAALASGLRREVAAIDDTLPVFGTKTMQQFLERSMWGSGAAAGLLGTLGLFVLALTAVGIHGVVSWSVSQRTREIGIRMALGAQAGRVLRLVVGHGLALALIGVLIGTAGALALTRILRNLLFGVSPTDPLTFVLMVGLLVLAALSACYLPARRATLVDPVTVLRQE
jgi:predicted permease